MDLSIVEPRSRWMTLLWKDFQQIKFVILAVSLGLLSIQTITVIWELADDSIQPLALFESLPVWVFIGPALVAIGCAGMLIGQERQSNTWNWQSSLPISWLESLSSKIMVTLVASLATAVFLAAIPAILMAMGQLPLFNTPDAIDQFKDFTIAGGIGLIQVVAVCFLASLLIREPINALASAGIFLVVGQWLLAAILFGYFFRLAQGTEYSAFVRLGMSIFTLGFVSMVFAYRWRWGSGQLSEMRLGSSSSAKMPATYRLQYPEGNAPRVWSVLLIHGWRNSIGLRLVSMLGVLLFAVASAGTRFDGLSDSMVLLVVFLCGLSVFEGDRSLGRFRFLADRGVNPWSLVTSRLVVVVALLIVFLLLCSPFLHMGGVLPSLAVLSIAFCVPALMSMVFPKPVMAGGVALVLCLGNAFWASMSNWSYASHCALIQSALLVVTIYVLARRWIVLDDVRVPLTAVAVAMVVIFSPWLALVLLR